MVAYHVKDQSYSRRLPALGRKLSFQLFFPQRSRPTQLRFPKISKEHPHASHEFPI